LQQQKQSTNRIPQIIKEDKIAERKLKEQIALTFTSLLKTAKITREELAKTVQISMSQMDKIMAADSNPTIKTLLNIGQALQHDIKISFTPKA
jgi:transcriptional regulator with XRE-family HTH domain